MTEKLSDNKLSNISILDLSAFGSRLSNLDKLQTSEPNWPNEVNFAIHQKFLDSNKLGKSFHSPLRLNENKQMD